MDISGGWLCAFFSVVNTKLLPTAFDMRDFNTLDRRLHRKACLSLEV